MREIPLTRGYVAKVDDADYERVMAEGKWYARVSDGSVYACRQRARKTVQMHRFIIGAPRGVQVDHKDADGLNNQRANLRTATQTQNNGNLRLRSHPKSSRYKGVYWWRSPALRSGGYWKAQLTISGRRHVKYAKSEEHAARLYNEMAQRHFGEFARLNEVPA